MTYFSRLVAFLLIFASIHEFASAQGLTGRVGDFQEITMEQLRIGLGVPANYHASIRPYRRTDAVEFAYTIEGTEDADIRGLDRLNYYYLFRNNNEFLKGPPIEWDGSELIDGPMTYILSQKSFLGAMYRTPANAVEINSENFSFRLNPVLGLSSRFIPDVTYFGKATAGLEMRGIAQDRFYFNADVRAVQQSLSPHEEYFRFHHMQAFPGASDVEETRVNNLHQYLETEAYAGIRIVEGIDLQMGYGRNFIGNGIRSLFLSDFAPAYFYLRGNIQFGRLHYQTIYAELPVETIPGRPPFREVSGKFMSAQYLSFQFNPSFRMGLFEATMFNRSGHFEMNYLLPIIGIRSLQNLGSNSDNTMLGLDFEWLPTTGVSLYGQFLLQNANLREAFAERNGYVNNRAGVQLGAKYFHAFGIRNLDLGTEFNTIRPFTYTSGNAHTTYSHHFQSLAHPLGANFRELILRLRYQPSYKWEYYFHAVLANQSRGSLNRPLGDKVWQTDVRATEYGHFIADGSNANKLGVHLRASHQFRANLFFDLFTGVNSYRQSSFLPIPDQDQYNFYLGGGIRLNLVQRDISLW